jgi:hypothetical protein
MTLIEQLKNGEVYVKNDCTPEEMDGILKLAFPKDAFNGTCSRFMRWECFGLHPELNYEWMFFRKDEPEHLKAISAQEFLNEIKLPKE